MSFNTPILILTFNRIDATKKVFQRIKDQKPKYLFWASDGPRLNRLDDLENIKILREYLLKQIDWDCELKVLFRDENLGCGRAVSSAITWFFENVEYGIILEDDCLPFPEFFSFCEELLEYYKNDGRVWEISGSNLQKGIKRGEASYYFSNYGGIWGWASWARAWKFYDFNLDLYDQFVKENKIKSIFADSNQQKLWIKELIESKKVDTWDYQWMFTRWNFHGLSVVPNLNLITNIGFDSDGTHAKNEPKWYKPATIRNGQLHEIIHANNVEVNIEADNFLYKNYFKPPNLFIRALNRLRRALHTV